MSDKANAQFICVAQKIKEVEYMDWDSKCHWEGYCHCLKAYNFICDEEYDILLSLINGKIRGWIMFYNEDELQDMENVLKAIENISFNKLHNLDGKLVCTEN